MHWDWSRRQRLSCVDIYMVAYAHTKKIHGSPLLMWFFALHWFEECEKSPPSNNVDITSLFWADSIDKYGRHDDIRIFAVEINDDHVYERLLELANEIRVTTCKQDISVCHRLSSRNPGSRPIFAQLPRRGTTFFGLTYERDLKNSSKKL